MTKETPVGHFVNIRRLFRGLHHAIREPEVQGVFMLAVTLILIATIFYWLVEGWSFLDAAYFSVVTIATVGYGDLAPQTVLGKLFTIGYLFAGIGLFVAAVTALAQATLRSARPPARPRSEVGWKKWSPRFHRIG
jgi:voltage-gated potassium channel